MSMPGAGGIVFPQIDTPEQAATAVYKVSHAYNGGMRSISPISLYDGITNIAPEGWTSETIADRNVAVICQIESTVGVENVDAIARTPGVNALMVGIADLKATMGIPIRNPKGLIDESEFQEAMSKIIATSRKTGIQLMIPAFRLKPEDTGLLKNFKMVLTSVDVLSVLKTHRSDLAQMKQALGVADVPSNGVSNGKLHGKTNGKINGKINGITHGLMIVELSPCLAKCRPAGDHLSDALLAVVNVTCNLSYFPSAISRNNNNTVGVSNNNITRLHMHISYPNSLIYSRYFNSILSSPHESPSREKGVVISDGTVHIATDTVNNRPSDVSNTSVLSHDIAPDSTVRATAIVDENDIAFSDVVDPVANTFGWAAAGDGYVTYSC
ncbi:macrophomate synthase [Fusarium langsethiae]|uniref:Macrophomate synthase n=1 Tax=Fusarium langsethiae TaxID=179993 RepID=A0A0M9ELL3_FUSLA|nr:macrophomate synthase [Fusarium langsethiae]